MAVDKPAFGIVRKKRNGPRHVIGARKAPHGHSLRNIRVGIAPACLICMIHLRLHPPRTNGVDPYSRPPPFCAACASAPRGRVSGRCRPHGLQPPPGRRSRRLLIDHSAASSIFRPNTRYDGNGATRFTSITRRYSSAVVSSTPPESDPSHHCHCSPIHPPARTG